MSLKKRILGFDADYHWKLRTRFINCHNKLLRMFYYVRISRMESKYNAETGISYHDPSARFGSQPYFPHGLNGVIISRKACIGKRAIILQQVTIGTAMVKEMVSSDLKGPCIGDNVYIGAGAKVIGDIIIGSNVIIGANAVVTKDIPDNCTAVGVPARIIERNPKYKLQSEKSHD